MRYFFGKIADKTKKYWPMTILGYILDVLAVPALALVGENGWLLACVLLVIQRIGKAIKKPAKDTIMSFAASQEGVGMGAQESILKAVVTSMVPKTSRATGYGIFECSFGIFWFLGSWLLGVLYDISNLAMIIIAISAQLIAIPFYLKSEKA